MKPKRKKLLAKHFIDNKGLYYKVFYLLQEREVAYIDLQKHNKVDNITTYVINNTDAIIQL